MSGAREFLLDANVFIQAKRRYYAFDLCPGFWECLVWHHHAGRIHCVDRVKQELDAGKDELEQWATLVMPNSCFASTDEPSVIDWFGKMNTWVYGQTQFFPEAKAEFAGGTDGWLIAYAKAKDSVLVTHEALARDARRKVPIPSVCEAFGVVWVDTFEMLKELGVEFSWKPE